MGWTRHGEDPVQRKACWKFIGCLKKLFDKDAKLRDTYKKTLNYNGIRRRRFIAQCHGLTGADISALIMSVASEKNPIRPGSLKRQIDFVDLRDLKTRLTNDPALLPNTIADGPAFADQDTGDDMYPVLKQENTSSYIYRRAIARGISRPPMSFPQRGITRSAILHPQGDV